MHTIFLVITIDTEEDQWNHWEEKVSVTNVSALTQLQAVFDKYGFTPTYLVNYPVAADPGASKILEKILNRGRCEIGTHLHPWNTPPIREAKNKKNSMLGNLSYELQLEKIFFATDFIEKRFGLRPISFRAGRWGLGRNTIRALMSCGYQVDTSVTPFLSWEADGGPPFVSETIDPYFINLTNETLGQIDENAILEIPATIGYSRWPFKRMRSIERMIEDLPACLHAKGLANRLNIVRKISLDPEAENIGNMLLLSRLAIEKGIKVLNVFFHSNSLVPGLSPFIKTETELNELYDRLSRYFESLLSFADVRPVELSKIRQMIDGYQQNYKNIGML